MQTINRIMVTGGAGFIGSHLVDALLKEHIEVTVLDNFSTGRPENLEHVRKQIELVECDLSVQGDWIQHFNKVDWVIHLAALADIVPSIKQPREYFRANVDGTFNIFAVTSAWLKNLLLILPVFEFPPEGSGLNSLIRSPSFDSIFSEIHV